MTEFIAGRYRITELVATEWNAEMAARFPNADHHGCRQQMRKAPPISYKRGPWIPYEPPRCMDWHCNRCGAPTGMMGHRDCPDRPAP